MIYGFLDESGVSGVATEPDDFYVVCMVLFFNREGAEKCIDSIKDLRKNLRLPEDYEFHYASNTTRVQQAFIENMKGMSFRFIVASIRKTGARRVASDANIAKYLLDLAEGISDELKIKMDRNPNLYQAIKKGRKNHSFKKLRCSEARSESDDLLQLADYVTALSAKYLRGVPYSKEKFETISQKMLGSSNH